jgi:hypothetical protein
MLCRLWISSDEVKSIVIDHRLVSRRHGCRNSPPRSLYGQVDKRGYSINGALDKCRDFLAASILDRSGDTKPNRLSPKPLAVTHPDYSTMYDDLDR